MGYWLNGETNGIIIGLTMTIGMIFKLVSLHTHTHIIYIIVIEWIYYKFIIYIKVILYKL